MQQSYYKIPILAAVTLGVALTMICLTHGWFRRTSPLKDSREPTRENSAVQDDPREAIIAVTPHQALPPSRRPDAPDRHSDDDESPTQSSASVAPLEKPAHKGVHGGKETAKAPRASRPVVKPKLVASSATVEETERGPVATFRFSPTTTDPIGPVMIVAFLAPGSDAKILDLSPTGSSAFSGIDKRISENGWFAAFQGTPQEITNLSFHLSVSQPVIATIKGNCGIKPFEIDLRPGR